MPGKAPLRGCGPIPKGHRETTCSYAYRPDLRPTYFNIKTDTTRPATLTAKARLCESNTTSVFMYSAAVARTKPNSHMTALTHFFSVLDHGTGTETLGCSDGVTANNDAKCLRLAPFFLKAANEVCDDRSRFSQEEYPYGDSHYPAGGNYQTCQYRTVCKGPRRQVKPNRSKQCPQNASDTPYFLAVTRHSSSSIHLIPPIVLSQCKVLRTNRSVRF